jgi:hypothetical protein
MPWPRSRKPCSPSPAGNGFRTQSSTAGGGRRRRRLRFERTPRLFTGALPHHDRLDVDDLVAVISALGGPDMIKDTIVMGGLAGLLCWTYIILPLLYHFR